MKFHRHIMALGAAVFMLHSGPSFALEQLPLPEPVLHADSNIVIAQFVANPPSQDGPCVGLLQKNYDRIGAIKSYRACRAEHALQELAAGKWQQAEVQIPD